MHIWPARGIAVFVYLDDLFIVAPTQQQCELHFQAVQELLQLSSFLIHHKKCVSPCQLLGFPGILMDFVKGVVTVPNHKRRSCKKDPGKLLSHDSLSLRSASSVLGKVRSLFVCLLLLSCSSNLHGSGLTPSYPCRRVSSPRVPSA